MVQTQTEDLSLKKKSDPELLFRKKKTSKKIPLKPVSPKKIRSAELDIPPKN